VRIRIVSLRQRFGEFLSRFPVCGSSGPAQEVTTREHFYLAHRPEEAGRADVAQLIDWIVSEFGTHESN
jgi:hypothetical protein